MNLKKIYLNFYKLAYSIEYLALKNNLCTEAELYDIRFKIQRKVKNK